MVRKFGFKRHVSLGYKIWDKILQQIVLIMIIIRKKSAFSSSSGNGPAETVTNKSIILRILYNDCSLEHDTKNCLNKSSRQGREQGSSLHLDRFLSSEPHYTIFNDQHFFVI